MIDKDFQERLKIILRGLDGQISIYDLAKKLNMNVHPMLEKIIPIHKEFTLKYKRNYTNMVSANNVDFMKQFFKTDIIDLGFLIQHKIKEIADSLKEKHNTMGHQMFYDSWLLYKGY